MKNFRYGEILSTASVYWRILNGVILAIVSVYWRILEEYLNGSILAIVSVYWRILDGAIGNFLYIEEY